MKIYTKTGDKGTSATFTGERRNKDDLVFHALGSTDELSCHLGLAREYCGNNFLDLNKKLEEIQCILQDIGSVIATPKSSARKSHLDKTAFDSDLTLRLEKWIDEYSEILPPLRNFILPSGGIMSCQLHIARTICRRAERMVVPLVRDDEIPNDPAQYLNRLSDFLFTAARYASFKEDKKEEIYHKVLSSKN